MMVFVWYSGPCMVPLPGAAIQNKIASTFDHSVILIMFLRGADHKSWSSSRSPSAVESLKVSITPLVLQPLSVAPYLTFTRISFPDGRQVRKLRRPCAFLTMGRSRFFSSAPQRQRLPLVPRRPSFPPCVGNVQRWRHESIFLLAPCPASARCSCTRTLNMSPSPHSCSIPPPASFFSPPPLLVCCLILHIRPVWQYREGLVALCVSVRLRLKCDGTRAENRFFRRNGWVNLTFWGRNYFFNFSTPCI